MVMFILFISMYELFVRVRVEYLPMSSRGGQGGDAPYMWSRRWWVGLCVVGRADNRTRYCVKGTRLSAK